MVKRGKKKKRGTPQKMGFPLPTKTKRQRHRAVAVVTTSRFRLTVKIFKKKEENGPTASLSPTTFSLCFFLSRRPLSDSKLYRTRKKKKKPVVQQVLFLTAILTLLLSRPRQKNQVHPGRKCQYLISFVHVERLFVSSSY